MFKLGNIIKYIPYPVTIGFTSGIALLIFTSQIKDFLGLNIENMPAEFIHKIKAISNSLNTININALSIGLLTILISIIWSKKFKKIPGSLIAIIITTLLVSLLDLPVSTIGSKFGNVPNMLPLPKIPHFSISLVKEMFIPGLTIAILAGIESLLSAVVADGMLGTKHNSNIELIGQGIANIFSPIFGGIPATGAIARTATNIKNGGRTPFAGIIHALTLLSIMIFLGKLAVLIPMPALAGILIIVSYNMSELKHFIKMRKAPKSDGIVLIITFLLTIFSDLTVAIQFGVIASALLFMKRMSDVSESDILKKEFYVEDEEFIASGIVDSHISKKIEIFEINGPFFFGAASLFRDKMSQIEPTPKILILRMRNVSAIDATGLAALEWIIDSTSKKHTKIMISGIQKQVLKALIKSGLDKKIGSKFICENINIALECAKNYLMQNNK